MSLFTKPGRGRTRQELSRFAKQTREKHGNSQATRWMIEAYKNGAHFVNYAEIHDCETPEEQFRWELKNFPYNTNRLRLQRALELGVDLSQFSTDEVLIRRTRRRQ